MIGGRLIKDLTFHVEHDLNLVCKYVYNRDKYREIPTSMQAKVVDSLVWLYEACEGNLNRGEKDYWKLLTAQDVLDDESRELMDRMASLYNCTTMYGNGFDAGAWNDEGWYDYRPNTTGVWESKAIPWTS